MFFYAFARAERVSNGLQEPDRLERGTWPAYARYAEFWSGPSMRQAGVPPGNASRWAATQE